VEEATAMAVAAFAIEQPAFASGARVAQHYAQQG
jgi:hypothetical protein